MGADQRQPGRASTPDQLPGQRESKRSHDGGTPHDWQQAAQRQVPCLRDAGIAIQPARGCPGGDSRAARDTATVKTVRSGPRRDGRFGLRGGPRSRPVSRTRGRRAAERLLGRRVGQRGRGPGRMTSLPGRAFRNGVLLTGLGNAGTRGTAPVTRLSLAPQEPGMIRLSCG